MSFASRNTSSISLIERICPSVELKRSIGDVVVCATAVLAFAAVVNLSGISVRDLYSADIELPVLVDDISGESRFVPIDFGY